MDKLKVADFFCGAGGFSEGFRQAGFEIVFALDMWAPARETHKLNHPNCLHPGLDCHEEKGDILNIDPLEVNLIIEDVDVIIGSPPCVSFSSSNCAGKADKSHGIKLIKKYLQIIAIKKYKPNSILKYWLLENVPNTKKVLKSEYSFKDIGLTDDILHELGIDKRETETALEIEISSDSIFNAANYGVPQRRERLIVGEFPVPKPTHEKNQWLKLGDVIKALNEDIITDPNYAFSIPSKELTDHFYDTHIHEFEWKRAYDRKQQARYYGKMSFPEDFSKPSRTVMASKSATSREAIIYEGSSSNTYRLPTIREIATLMTFPVTYLFQANNEDSKHRLVGNAVCPKLAFSFAKEILEKERLHSDPQFDPKTDRNKLKFDLNGCKITKTLQNRHIKANFVEIVPDLKTKNFRVELDNNNPRNTENGIKWSASLHHGTGIGNMKEARPKIEDVLVLLERFHEKEIIDQFLKANESTFKNKIPTADIFQEQYFLVEPDIRFLTPRDALHRSKEIIDEYFPVKEYGNEILSNLDKLNRRIIEFSPNEIPYEGIPLRIVAALYSVSYFCSLTKSI